MNKNIYTNEITHFLLISLETPYQSPDLISVEIRGQLINQSNESILLNMWKIGTGRKHKKL